MAAPTLGRYQLVAELGRGAMGIVYKATDPELGRTVAVKMIHLALSGAGGEEYQKRFAQEARAAGGLNHPAIVTIYDIGREHGIAYMAMEYIEGTELRKLMQPGERLPLGRAITIAAEVAEGLAYAHSHGIVHRDVKPANIMVLASGAIKIMDFGIARMRSAEELTQTGTQLGSPKYMSPEQVLGRRADHQADIFALGVILYEMLTGVAPFTGDSVTAIMYQTVHLVPPAPSVVNGAVPELLDYVVSKALAKAQDERYASAEALATDLRRCLAVLGETTQGGAVPQRAAGSLATGTQPTLLDVDLRSEVLAPAGQRTRERDTLPPVEETSGPAHRISRAFESTDATQRILALTRAGGAAPEESDISTTQALRVARSPEKRRWRRRDWLLLGGAALLGLLVARGLRRRAR